MKIALGFVISLFPLPALSQDLCRDVLSEALINQSSRNSSSSSEESDRSFYCSSSLDEGRSYYEKKSARSGGSSGGGSVGWGPFKASGQAGSTSSNADSLTQDEYNLWKSENCSESERNSASRAFEYEAQRNASSEAIEAWRQCMVEQEGLNCWTEPNTEQTVRLVINWRKLSRLDAYVTQSYIEGGISRWPKADPGTVLPDSMKILAGKLTIPISREGKKAVTITYNMTHDASAYSCSTYVPQIREPRPVQRETTLIQRQQPLVVTVPCPIYVGQECSDITIEDIKDFGVLPEYVYEATPGWSVEEVTPAFTDLINPEISNPALQTEEVQRAFNVLIAP